MATAAASDFKITVQFDASQAERGVSDLHRQMQHFALDNMKRSKQVSDYMQAQAIRTATEEKKAYKTATKALEDEHKARMKALKGNLEAQKAEYKRHMDAIGAMQKEHAERLAVLGGRGFPGMQEGFGGLQGAMTGVIAKAGLVGAAVVGVGKAIGAAATAAWDAGKAFLQFQDNAKFMSTMLSREQAARLPEAMDRLRESALRIGKPIQELQAGFQALITGPFRGLADNMESTTKLTETFGKVSQITKAPIDELTTGIGNFTNAMGVSLTNAEGVEEMLGVMLKTTAEAGITTEKFVEIAGKGGAVIKLLSENSSESAKALGIVTVSLRQAGISANFIDDRVSALGRELLDTGRQAQLTAMGIRGIDAETGKITDWSVLLKDLSSRGLEVADVFSQDVRPIIGMLAREGGAATAAIADDFQKAGNTIDEMYSRVADSAQLTEERLKAQRAELELQMGKVFAPMVQTLSTIESAALSGMTAVAGWVAGLFQSAEEKVAESLRQAEHFKGIGDEISVISANIGAAMAIGEEPALAMQIDRIKSSLPGIAEVAPFAAQEIERLLSAENIELPDKLEKINALLQGTQQIAQQMSEQNAFQAMEKGADVLKESLEEQESFWDSIGDVFEDIGEVAVTAVGALAGPVGAIAANQFYNNFIKSDDATKAVERFEEMFLAVEAHKSKLNAIRAELQQLAPGTAEYAAKLREAAEVSNQLSEAAKKTADMEEAVKLHLDNTLQALAAAGDLRADHVTKQDIINTILADESNLLRESQTYRELLDQYADSALQKAYEAQAAEEQKLHLAALETDIQYGLNQLLERAGISDEQNTRVKLQKLKALDKELEAQEASIKLVVAQAKAATGLVAIGQAQAKVQAEINRLQGQNVDLRLDAQADAKAQLEALEKQLAIIGGQRAAIGKEIATIEQQLGGARRGAGRAAAGGGAERRRVEQADREAEQRAREREREEEDRRREQQRLADEARKAEEERQKEQRRLAEEARKTQEERLRKEKELIDAISKALADMMSNLQKVSVNVSSDFEKSLEAFISRGELIARRVQGDLEKRLQEINSLTSGVTQIQRRIADIEGRLGAQNARLGQLEQEGTGELAIWSNLYNMVPGLERRIQSMAGQNVPTSGQLTNASREQQIQELTAFYLKTIAKTGRPPLSEVIYALDPNPEIIKAHFKELNETANKLRNTVALAETELRELRGQLNEISGLNPFQTALQNIANITSDIQRLNELLPITEELTAAMNRIMNAKTIDDANAAWVEYNKTMDGFLDFQRDFIGEGQAVINVYTRIMGGANDMADSIEQAENRLSELNERLLSLQQRALLPAATPEHRQRLEEDIARTKSEIEIIQSLVSSYADLEARLPKITDRVVEMQRATERMSEKQFNQLRWGLAHQDMLGRLNEELTKVKDAAAQYADSLRDANTIAHDEFVQRLAIVKLAEEQGVITEAEGWRLREIAQQIYASATASEEMVNHWQMLADSLNEIAEGADVVLGGLKRIFDAAGQGTESLGKAIGEVLTDAGQYAASIVGKIVGLPLGEIFGAVAGIVKGIVGLFESIIIANDEQLQRNRRMAEEMRRIREELELQNEATDRQLELLQKIEDIWVAMADTASERMRILRERFSAIMQGLTDFRVIGSGALDDIRAGIQGIDESITRLSAQLYMIDRELADPEISNVRKAQLEAERAVIEQQIALNEHNRNILMQLLELQAQRVKEERQLFRERMEQADFESKLAQATNERLYLIGAITEEQLQQLNDGAELERMERRRSELTQLIAVAADHLSRGLITQQEYNELLLEQIELENAIIRAKREQGKLDTKAQQDLAKLIRQRQELILAGRQRILTEQERERIRALEREIIAKMQEAGASPEAIAAALEAFRGAKYQRGTAYVPRTELALVHKGERIFSATENQDFIQAIYNLQRATMEAYGYRPPKIGATPIKAIDESIAIGKVDICVESAPTPELTAEAIWRRISRLHEADHRKQGSWNGR